MQHVERWNDYEVAGGFGMIFKRKGAVWNAATQRTEANDLQLRSVGTMGERFCSSGEGIDRIDQTRSITLCDIKSRNLHNESGV
jgi:hypothetical protein